MTDQNDVLQRYLDRVTPIFREMFGIAHAITDQYESAEYAVQQAIQRGFVLRRKRRGDMTFNEMMKLWVIRYASEQVKQNGHPADGEGTWTGFDDVNVAGNAFLVEAVREPLQMRRILMMKFGAGLHSYEIAPLVDMDKKRVRSYLQQYEARVMRRLRGQNASYEKLARRAAQQELTRIDADIPDTSATFRQLQSDLVDAVHPATTARVNPLNRAIGIFFLSIGVVLCVLLFWLFAVLMDSGEGMIAQVAAPAVTEAPELEAP